MSAGVATTVGPARRTAFIVLRRVFEHGAYADRALHAEAAELSPRDRALATRLAFGAVPRRATLAQVIEQLTERPLARLEPAVRSALRLGLYELLFLSGAPAHAVVADAVELSKAAGGGRGGPGLVNAVLRRAAREGQALLEGLDDRTPRGAAVLHSIPEWLSELWWAELGPETARALMAAANEPAESALRANTLVNSAQELAERLPVASHRVDDLPEALVLEARFDAHGSELWREGAFTPQSRAALLPARVQAPAPGDRVLALCAAPGAKTTHLAALMGDDGEVVAVERHPGRARSLTDTARRLHAACVRVEVGDAAELPAPVRRPDGYDGVLIDPPCSGLGTLSARPDLRWRVTPQEIKEMAAQQGAILRAGAAAVVAGGRLVYSTCTISPAENERVIGEFLQANPDFDADDLGAEWPAYRHPNEPRHLLTLPHRDGTAGFFVARLRRR